MKRKSGQIEKKGNFLDMEKKWQKQWAAKKVFEVKEGGKKKKCYVLEMFPYPSGTGLHMGHAFNYTIGDIYSRYKRMQGFNVLYPMGYDSFGLPAENAAIKAGAHPKKYTEEAIANFVRQQHALGLSYDWNRVLKTSDSEYYKWNQYWFLQFYKKGLVYRKKASVNWCLKCNTVLANEQVHQGKCWRHPDIDVQLKQLEQWFIKSTKYVDELLEKLNELNWPERIKAMQRNWIGKSDGAEIVFNVNGKVWKVFTTRPDTLFGVTFLVVSLHHPRLQELVTEQQKKSVEAFLKKSHSTKQEDIDQMEKEGVFTGNYAVHPLTGEKIPVWAGNFVLAEYGGGMVMAVPAHDQRDFMFAKKYGLKIKIVINSGERELKSEDLSEAYTDSGVLINSGAFNDLSSEEAHTHIIRVLEEKHLGNPSVQYKMRDWLISRQRYWGTPIPIVYCDLCEVVPVPEKDLPVLLPKNVKFGQGNPLATNKQFVNVRCPKCGKEARRETDTMDTFFDSSWYFLRFCDSLNKKMPFDKKKVAFWMPVDTYIGGAEHACMHLIYARFFMKVLVDIGYLPKEMREPFGLLFNQGMIHGKDGFVMSKSRGNVIDPTMMIEKYGADALRFFLVSMALPDKDTIWSDTGIEGTYRFLKKTHDFFERVKIKKTSRRIESILHNTIRKITENIESFRYNLALIAIRELFDNLENEISAKDMEIIALLLSPFCPHFAEEIWHTKLKKKGFASLASWPKYDGKKIDERLEKIEKGVNQTVSDVANILKILKEKQNKDAEKIFLYVLPQELGFYDGATLTKRIGKCVQVYAVNDKSKYDPQNKSAKARPFRPAIYVE